MTNAEIQVGEYVRLERNQGINKIISSDDDFYILDEDIADDYGDITSVLHKNQIGEEIVNHSFNIIDLIEVGDYVNGCLISEVDKTKKEIRVNDYYVTTFKNEHIKSIVTHEQFKSMEYKVGGEDE